MSWFNLTRREAQPLANPTPQERERGPSQAQGLGALRECLAGALGRIAAAMPGVEREAEETARTQSMYPIARSPWGEPTRGGVDLAPNAQPGRGAPDPRADYGSAGRPVTAAMAAQTGGAGRLSGPALEEQRRGVGSALGGDGGVGGPTPRSGMDSSNLMRSGAVGASQLPPRTARPSPGRKHRGW